MARSYAPAWQTGSPIQLRNMSDVTIPAYRIAIMLWNREGSGVMLVPDDTPTLAERFDILAAFVAQTNVPAGAIGEFFGRSGDIVVIQASGVCTAGRPLYSPFGGTGRVENYVSTPLGVCTESEMVAMHDALANELVEVMIR